MNYPSRTEYLEAIKIAEDNFDQLKNLRPVLGEDGEPVMTNGNFAVVFKMKDENTGKVYAVKCFTREQEGRAEAYRQIAEELEFVNSTFLTPIKYLDKELFVDTNASDDTEFPVLQMDWVEGETLDKYIRNHLDDQYELSLLAYQFSRLAMWLMPQPFAHGDLKPDNILVKNDGTLVLVDYDGMYVPAMKGQRARELGSPDFRHPSRTETDFDEHIDDFSLASILLSLKAIALQPELLEEYGASDRLLFSEKNYRNLSESKILDAVKTLMQDTELASLYSLFILALSQNNLSQVSFRLFNLSRPERPQHVEENLSTEVTEEDLASAWTDEYGVMYSTDRKRLLRAPKDISEYSVREGTKVICDGDICRVVLSDNKKRRIITKLGEGAFNKCDALKSISFPRSLIKIGDSAFRYCKSLSHIIIPDSVKEIGNRAFGDCSAIKECVLSKSLSFIGDWAFRDCKCLKHIVIQGPVDEIGNYAFGDCKELKSVTLPNSVSSIGNYAFDGCKLLSSIVVPTSLRKIGIRAFRGCESLEYFDMPDLVSIIGMGAFEKCRSLKMIKIPTSIEKIEEWAFQGCKSISTITIPNSINEIGDCAFLSCDSLEIIHIPNSVKTIGNSSFSDCKLLKQIIIPDSVVKIGDYAFANCVSLIQIDIPDSVKEIGKNPLSLCKNINVNCSTYKGNALYSSDFKKLISYIDKGNRLFEVPNSVNEIGNSAFYECGNLTQVIIPDSVKRIKREAFGECWNLKAIIIPSSVTHIEDTAFLGCRNLSKVKILNPNIQIEKWSFKFCNTNLIISVPTGTKAKFQEMLPSQLKEKIVEQDENENLSTEVTEEDLANAWTDEYGSDYSLDRTRLLAVPANVKDYTIKYGTLVICDYAFCMKDEDVIIGGNIVNVEIPDTISKIGNCAFTLCSSLKKIIIPSSVIEIGNGAFDSCETLSDVVIPNSVMKIGNSAFAHCHGLKTITIPKSVAYIGMNPFRGCEELNTIICKSDNYILEEGALFSKDMSVLISYLCKGKSYSVPNGVVFIGNSAFSCFRNLSEIIIPDSVKEIGNWAFSGCTSLKHISIPPTITHIGFQAFFNCESLTQIKMPESIVQIGNDVFGACYSLKRIIVPKGYIKKYESLLSEWCWHLLVEE